MSVKLYSEELKIEAVKQITERNYPIGQVSKRLGATPKIYIQGLQAAVRPTLSPYSTYKHCKIIPIPFPLISANISE